MSLILIGKLESQTPPLGHDGWTFCNSKGEIEVWFRDRSLAGTIMPPAFGYKGEVDALRMHEQAHVVQILRAGGCKIANMLLTEAIDTIVAWEAEAYCEQAKILENNGGPSLEELNGLMFTNFIESRRLDAHRYIKLWSSSWKKCANK